jgi:hypothetical protein
LHGDTEKKQEGKRQSLPRLGCGRNKLNAATAVPTSILPWINHTSFFILSEWKKGPWNAERTWRLLNVDLCHPDGFAVQ